MSRPIRIEYPGAINIITSRGNDGSDVFLNEDRNKFYEDFVKGGKQTGTPWREIEGQPILGRKNFVEKIKGLLQTKESV